LLPLHLINPASINNITSMMRWNKMPSLVFKKSLILLIHCLPPPCMIQCFINMFWLPRLSKTCISDSAIYISIGSFDIVLQSGNWMLHNPNTRSRRNKRSGLIRNMQWNQNRIHCGSNRRTRTNRWTRTPGRSGRSRALRICARKDNHLP
jgi:hypothetical protein